MDKHYGSFQLKNGFVGASGFIGATSRLGNTNPSLAKISAKIKRKVMFMCKNNFITDTTNIVNINRTNTEFPV